MLERIRIMIQEETLAERSRRMIPAALFAALIATAYVFTFFLVNVYTFPSLPLAVDWGRLLMMWIGFAAGFALFGAIATWFTDDPAGIVGGGLVMTLVLAILFLISSGARDTALTMQSIIMALPLIGVCMLAAWGLRWTARRYLEIKREAKPDGRKRLAKHVLTLVLAGLVPGILMRMDLPSVQALDQLDSLLQAAPTDPSVLPRLPLKRVPALQDHFGVDYKFYVRNSTASAGSLDVTIRFEDGFVMSCLLPVGSGSFITDCGEGERFEPGS